MPPDYYWILPGQLAGAAFPFTQLEAYHALGFHAIVSLVPVPLPSESQLARLGFRSLETPVSLFGWPEEEQAEEIMRFVDECLATDQPVLVHCLQGNGRTGAVLAQYLVWRGWSVDRAVNHVYAARETAFDVMEQEDAVETFARWLESRGHVPEPIPDPPAD